MRVFKQRMLHCILLIKNDYERKTFETLRPFENIYTLPVPILDEERKLT